MIANDLDITSEEGRENLNILKADLINSSNNEKYDKFFDAIFSTKDVKRISELTKKMCLMKIFMSL